MKTDLEKWNLIKILNWKNESKDPESIARRCIKLVGRDEWKELGDFVQEKVSELHEAIRVYEEGMGNLDIGSDDGFSDVCYHIVGLGKDEFKKCCHNPKLVEKRYNSPDGYEESFAYVFLEPEPERTPTDTKNDLDKIVEQIGDLTNLVESFSLTLELIRSEVSRLGIRIRNVKGDLDNEKR